MLTYICLLRWVELSFEKSWGSTKETSMADMSIVTHAVAIASRENSLFFKFCHQHKHIERNVETLNFNKICWVLHIISQFLKTSLEEEVFVSNSSPVCEWEIHTKWPPNDYVIICTCMHFKVHTFCNINFHMLTCAVDFL